MLKLSLTAYVNNKNFYGKWRNEIDLYLETERDHIVRRSGLDNLTFTGNTKDKRQKVTGINLSNMFV